MIFYWFFMRNVWKFNYSALVSHPSTSTTRRKVFLYFIALSSKSYVTIWSYGWTLFMVLISFSFKCLNFAETDEQCESGDWHFLNLHNTWNRINFADHWSRWAKLSNMISKTRNSTAPLTLAWFMQTIVRYEIGK